MDSQEIMIRHAGLDPASRSRSDYWIPAFQTVSQLNKGVIPDSPTKEGELRARSEALAPSRKWLTNQAVLDPGSCHVPRDLAGMTNYDTVCFAGMTVLGYLITGAIMFLLNRNSGPCRISLEESYSTGYAYFPQLPAGSCKKLYREEA